MTRWLLITDTPGIEEFVFGTDTLGEIQGASALLDEFNRYELEPLMKHAWPRSVDKVFANGVNSSGDLLREGDPRGGVGVGCCTGQVEGR